jgi:quercetin dioxygenase-like cupin family protein
LFGFSDFGPFFLIYWSKLSSNPGEEGDMDRSGNRNQPYALRAGEGWTYRFGINFTIKASEVQPGSGAAFIEDTTRKGEEPPSHTHATEDEMFYVLEGSVSFRCGEKTFELEPGGFIFLPQGVEHGYTIRSEDPARLIVVTAPAREGASGGWGGFAADIEGRQGELISKPDI